MAALRACRLAKGQPAGRCIRSVFPGTAGAEQGVTASLGTGGPEGPWEVLRRLAGLWCSRSSRPTGSPLSFPGTPSLSRRWRAGPAPRPGRRGSAHASWPRGSHSSTEQQGCLLLPEGPWVLGKDRQESIRSPWGYARAGLADRAVLQGGGGRVGVLPSSTPHRIYTANATAVRLVS